MTNCPNCGIPYNNPTECCDACDMVMPYDPYCGRTPDEIPEYQELAEHTGMTPVEFVVYEEGTYNPENGYFACTQCYISKSTHTVPSERWRA